MDSQAIEWVTRTQLHTRHESVSLESADESDFLTSGGVVFHASDNMTGETSVMFTARVLRLGHVEVLASLRRQGPGQKPHSKLASLSGTPEALRDLAAELIRVADRAEKLRPRLKPIR